MSEPASASAIASSALGITIFGVVIGLRPELMLAGLWGAFWALSYAEPMPLYKRCTLSATASILSGYGTPAAMLFLEGLGFMQSAGASEKIQYPVAVGIGFLSHRILGPFLMRFAKKKVEEI